MSKFVEGDVVYRTGGDIENLPLGTLSKVIMRTGPSSIKLCNGMSYHEDGFRHATVKERLYYEDANEREKHELRKAEEPHSRFIDEVGFELDTAKEEKYCEDFIKGSYIEEQAQFTERPTLASPSVEFGKLGKPLELSAMEQQVGGTHYKDLGMQPMQLTLVNMGYEAFRGACYTKINKYMIRDKDAEVGQLKKAAHVLQMWIEEAEKQNG